MSLIEEAAQTGSTQKAENIHMDIYVCVCICAAYLEAEIARFDVAA